MDNNHLTKFTFLVVVIGAILFSQAYYHTPSLLGTSQANSKKTSLSAATVPLFVMPTVSAGTGAVQTATTSDTTTVQPKGVTPPPAVEDEAYLVADLSSGAVAASLNADRRWPTASLAKLMTATIALDRLSATTTITITEPMFAVDPTEQTLVVGGTYTVADIMRVMLLPSSNVAAQALADFYGLPNFIAAMNDRAAAWGMTDTYFGDPSGLSATNQSTATDFLTLAEKVYADYPQIFATTRTPQVYITEQNSGKKVLVKSINDFAGEPNFIGGKTGHTDEASGNLLSVFNDAGHPILVVVLGTNDRFGDTQKLYAWYKANIKP